MSKCADVQITLEMHRMLRTVPVVFIKTTRWHCFNVVSIPRDTATTKRPMGRKYWRKVWFWGTKTVQQCLNERQRVKTLPSWSASKDKQVCSYIHKQWCSQNEGQVLTKDRNVAANKCARAYRIKGHRGSCHSDCPCGDVFKHHVALSTREKTKSLDMVSVQWCGVKRWPRVHFQSSCAVHQSSRLAPSQHSQHDELNKDHILWRAAVNNDKCDFDSIFLTPFWQNILFWFRIESWRSSKVGIIVNRFVGSSDPETLVYQENDLSSTKETVLFLGCDLSLNWVLWMIRFSAEAICASTTQKSVIRLPLTEYEDFRSSIESANSTSLIHSIASVEKCEQIQTSILNLFFQ